MRLSLITGGSSGIGLETARSLASAGDHVVMVSRDRARGEAARAIVAQAGASPVDFMQGDLGSFAGVRALADRVLEAYPSIDVLISNAGVFNARRRVSPDGFERTFAVNHLASFLLVNLLLPRVRRRIVVTASAAHFGAPGVLDDVRSGWRAYQRSKLANVMFTYALARRLSADDVTVNCLHPGFVRTRLGSGNGIPIEPVYWLLYPWTISVREGAKTPVYVATSPEVDGLSGMYFDRCRPVPSSRDSYDDAMQEKLWAFSAEATGLT